MKLRISFFNRTVLRKDITRFAPVWGLYAIFTLMAFFLLWGSEVSAARFANSACYIMQSMGVINFVYATVCALVLFGDLFNTKLCNALHAFPLRREGWFATHCVSGFLFCLVPNTVAAFLAALLLQEYFYLALLWLGIMLLQFLFFFGAAVFSVMCAGNRLGAAAVCGIFNLLAVLAFWLFQTFYDPFLYGIYLDTEPYLNFSPVVGFHHFRYIETSYDKLSGVTLLKSILWEEWIYLFIAAGVGAILLLLAMLIYRRRHLENAGNLISLEPVGPLFLIIYTLCAGAVMYYVADIFSGNGKYVFIFLGFAIGFFTGRMLLEKKVNVFRGKAFLSFGILLAIFGVTVGLTRLDPVGITRYVPELRDVKQVKISPTASTYYWNNSDYVLTEEGDIQAILDVHQALIEDRPQNGHYDYLWLSIGYTLENGRTVYRQYQYDPDSTVGQVLKGYYSSWEYITGTENIEAVTESFLQAEFHASTEDSPYVIWAKEAGEDSTSLEEKYGYWEGGYISFIGEDFDEEMLRGLLEAVYADCEAGNLAQPWAYHEGHETYGWLMIQMDLEEENGSELVIAETYTSSNSGIEYVYDITTTIDIRICEDCTHTVAYLKSIANQ